MTRTLWAQATEAELKERMDTMRAELGSALQSQLSSAERAELKRLGPELERLQVRVTQRASGSGETIDTVFIQ